MKTIATAGTGWAFYSLVDGFHALVTLVGVFVRSTAGGVGETWTYTSLLGPVKTL